MTQPSQDSGLRTQESLLGSNTYTTGQLLIAFSGPWSTPLAVRLCLEFWVLREFAPTEQSDMK